MSAPGTSGEPPDAGSRVLRSLRGAFVTFEGIDGCGKSTQFQRIAGRLGARGHALRTTREPGGTAVGSALRNVLLDSGHAGLEPTVELLLYLADRVQHLAEVIRPALLRGETVLCDRYHDATIAYQRHGRGLDFSPLADFIASEIAPTAPDLTFWLDVPLEIAAKRMARRGKAQDPSAGDASRLDRESAAFHGRVRAGYETLWRAEPGRIVRIEASGAIEAVEGEIWRIFEERFDDL